jgi:PD-(D/E)XK nuclease superfamily protein
MDKPLRVSWSAIRTYEECSMKSALIRDGKRSKVSNIRNFFAGTVVDHIMRTWLDDPLVRYGDVMGLVTCAMDEMEDTERGKGNMVRWRNIDDRDQVRAFCAELITRLEPILEEHVLPYSYEHGKWFKVPMIIKDQNGHPRDILLTGEMDLLVQNRGPVVWDLKGTSDDQYWRKVIAQLTFYDIAVWASTGEKTRFSGLIQPMCSERVLAWQITDNARRNLLARIVRYAHDTWRNVRECTPNTGNCHWCDVRHACPRYTTDAFGTLADGLRRAAGDAA